MQTWDQSGVGLNGCAGCELHYVVAFAPLLLPTSPPSASQFALHKSPSLSTSKVRHGGSGIRSGIQMARSHLGSESQGPPGFIGKRYKKYEAKPGGTQPSGQQAFDLTTISIPRDSFLGQRPGVIVRPSSYGLCSVFLIHLCNK